MPVDLSDSQSSLNLICGIAIVVGIFGVIVPMLPGTVLCWATVLVWAILSDGGAARWVVFGIATLIGLTGIVVKYAWPGRNLKKAEVPNLSLLAGGALGLIGFFLIPIVGLVIGFILGVYLAEHARLGDSSKAWPSTKHAMKAAGLSMLIEFMAAVMIGATWLVGVLTL